MQVTAIQIVKIDNLASAYEKLRYRLHVTILFILITVNDSESPMNAC